MYLSLRKVDLSRIGIEIWRVSWPVLALSLVTKLLAFFFAGWRTSLILRPPAGIGWSRGFKSVLLAFSVNNVAPLRMGELARADYLARATGLTRTASLGVVAFERLLDLLSLALIVVPVLALAAIEIPGRSALGLYLVLPALGIAALWWLSRPSGLAFFRRRGHWLGARLGAAADRRLGDFERGLRGLESPRRLAGVVLASLGFWLMGLASLRIWIAAFGLELPWYAPVLLLAYTAFGAAIPSSPGFVGTYHFFVIAALTRLGVESDTAASLAVVGHFMAIVPFTLASVPLLLAEYLGRGRQRAQPTEEAEDGRLTTDRR